MKKTLCFLLAITMCFAFVGCGESADDRSTVVTKGQTVNDILNPGAKETVSGSKRVTLDVIPSDYQTVDVDLTQLNSTMVYSEVNNMMISPDDYVGKKILMNGTFTYGVGDERYYFACLIADAAACCSQGIEFVLKNDRSFPDEYPVVGTEITVVGVFDTYYEGTSRYCQLIDAYMI